MSEINLELQCFKERRSKEQGGLGAFRHFRNAHHMIWPQRVPTYNEWMHRRFKTFCSKKYKVVMQAGGAGTAKSADAAVYALEWWWTNPSERTVLICSTTLNALKKRIWSYIAEYRMMAPFMPGILKGGQNPCILFNNKDEKHGIFSIPLARGTTEQALKDLIGIHPKEAMLVIVDEMTDVTSAPIDAMTNWDASGKKFQMIGIGNSKDRLDTHGQLCEPIDGWGSINPDTHEEWLTRYGICLYFDCYKSPAVLHPEHSGPGGKLSFLIGPKKIEHDEKKLGKNHPRFWRFVRGFWPPDSATKTVLTALMADKHQIKKPAEFTGSYAIRLAALDPAFTADGDECILRFATLGTMRNGLTGLDFGGPENIVPLQLDARSSEPINYQIVQQARRECEARDIPPEHFACDVWGMGAGAGDIFTKEWSNKFHKVVSIGTPTELFTDVHQTERAYDVYDRRITELWFIMREFVLAGQIKGLDDQTVKEFCQRTWEFAGKKYSLEGKDSYRAKFQNSGQPSPDRADAACVLLDLARQLGFRPGRATIDGTESNEEWERQWEAQRHAQEMRDDPPRDSDPSQWEDNFQTSAFDNPDLSSMFSDDNQ